MAVAGEHGSVSRSTIKRWIREGLLPAYRPRRGVVLVDLNDLDKAIESQPVVPAAR
jgi:excisionase family DNA binding protein